MGQQIERLVKNYFTEEVIDGEESGNLRLVTGTRPMGNGKELKVAPGRWTLQEAVKFVEICIKNGIPPASMLDAAQ